MKSIIKCFIPMFILMGIQFICSIFTALFNLSHVDNIFMKQMLVYDIIGLAIFGSMYISKHKDNRVIHIGKIIILFAGLEICISGALNILSMLAPHIIESYVIHIENINIANTDLLTIMVTVILTPILEEIVYRGIILRYAEKTFNWFMFANIMQAAIFGISHLNLVQGIYAFFMGLVFGYIYKRYNTLFASIIGHITFNFMGTIGVSFVFGSVTDIKGSVFVISIALIISAFTFCFIQKE